MQFTIQSTTTAEYSLDYTLKLTIGPDATVNSFTSEPAQQRCYRVQVNVDEVKHPTTQWPPLPKHE